MTSHKGPPAPLVGPYHTVPSYGTASPLSRSQTQSYQGAPTGDVSEPAQKKQKLDDIAQRSQNKALRTNPPPAHVVPNPVSGDSDAGPRPEDLKSTTSKQPSLFPTRPNSCCKMRNKQQGSVLAIERAAMRHTVQTKAYVAEPPASAPRYHKTESADFFPWTGHHPEDALNEPTTRNGFYDKASASQNESLTARPSILSSLRNKSGLQILSSVFASALDQRQIHGKITAASTFKPPPRVTLTDTKKEAWLKDLANPVIPLRRLSRTIPHGIRGKILLDQCLSKDVPTSRAMWLVKCVGANEIRACKRKGTSGVLAVGGEAKWVQDWTAAVQQFLETIIDSWGSENWKTRLNYGLRLFSHIYAEGLLDHDQYLRWLVDHLATSSLDSLPLWLLITNICKQDLLRCRQHGKHLVEALLAQLNLAQNPINQAVYVVVLQELVKECKALMASHPECFLIPGSWKVYRDIIQDHVIQGNHVLESRFNLLSLRNQRLEDKATARGTKTYSSTEQTIVAALDSLAKVPNYPKVAGICLRASASSETLVETCIQWASSTYRHGQFRIYAAARLLQIWSKYSIDLQGSVFKFLAHSQDVPDIDPMGLYRLCAELVSSKHLSVARYFQWLMASGALHRRQENCPGNDGDTQLLLELPLHDLPDHLLNLRRSLLSSQGTAVEVEDSSLKAKKLQIARELPGLFPGNFLAGEEEGRETTLRSLSRSLKSEIAWWIRDSITPHQGKKLHEEHHSTQERASSMTMEEFIKLRHVFEEIQEYNLFAEILLELVKATTDRALLVAIADTVNFHFDTFNALGAAKALFNALLSKRKLSQSQDGAERSLNHGLTDLAIRLPSTGPELRRLRKEELSLDPKQSVAAPSPISDNMVEAVQSDTPTFFEEMDQILTNGTSMDQPTLTRCFGAIIGHLEMSWDEAVTFPCRYPELLSRLRAFDQSSFDVLVTSWLDTVAYQRKRPHLSQILAPMICHKVCTLDVIVDRLVKLSQATVSGQNAPIALELLEMLSSVESQHMPSVEYRSYRLLHQQQQILQTNSELFIPLVRRCIAEAGAMDSPFQAQADKLLSDANVLSFIRMIVSQISIDDKPTLSCDPDLRSALMEILSRDELSVSPMSSLSQKFRRLLDNVSNFNRPLTQLRLQKIVESALETEGSSSDVLTDVVMEKLGDAPHTRVRLWSHLVSSLPTASAVSIHARAEEAVLSRVGDDGIALVVDGKSATDSLMNIVVATSSGIPDALALSLLEQISERLYKLVSSLPVGLGKREAAIELDNFPSVIDILLRLFTVHQATILDPKFSQSTISRICLSLGHLYGHLAASSDPTLTIHVSDVLALISDALQPDTRSRCIEALSTSQGLHQDPRIGFIFGNANNNTLSAGGNWLQLVISKASPAAVAASTATATAATTITTSQPYPLRRWEMVQDATPVGTENDTSTSLTLFGARKSVL